MFCHSASHTIAPLNIHSQTADGMFLSLLFSLTEKVTHMIHIWMLHRSFLDTSHVTFYAFFTCGLTCTVCVFISPDRGVSYDSFIFTFIFWHIDYVVLFFIHDHILYTQCHMKKHMPCMKWMSFSYKSSLQLQESNLRKWHMKCHVC